MLRFVSAVKRYFTVFLFFLVISFLTACVKPTKASLEEIEVIDSQRMICTFEGIKHDFILDFPEETEGVPLIIMLPGYGNNAKSFRDMVHLELEANVRGYAVVYVTGAADSGDSTSALGWNSGIGNATNNDVDFLCAVVSYLEENYGFDSGATFAVGFSNGAFMTHRLAMEAGDTFEAVVSVAGKMSKVIWENRSDYNDISVFQITGEKDDVVPKNSDNTAIYAIDPAIEEVMEYWAESNGLTEEMTETIGKNSILTKNTGIDSTNQVWSLLVKDGRHSWPDKNINGIDTNSLILDFFEAQK